jgi:hypothetical protein
VDSLDVELLNALRRRNLEIAKAYYRNQGFQNILADYVVKGLGHGKKVRESLAKEDVDLLMSLAERYPRRRSFVVHILLYRQDFSDYFFVIILDEKMLARKYKTDSEILRKLVSSFTVRIHIIMEADDESTLAEAAAEFSNNHDIDIQNLRSDPRLRILSDKVGVLKPKKDPGS